MKKFLRNSCFGLAGLAALLLVFFAARQVLANAAIEREGQIVPTSVPPLETTSRLEIIPLYEEADGQASLLSGHGVSYLIKTDAGTILMDLGNNPSGSDRLPSLQNMQKLGIRWEELDAIVITHPHPDHTGGPEAWQDRSVWFGDFTGDLSHLPIYTPIPMSYPGAVLTHSAAPTPVSRDIATTGVIAFPEVYPFSLAEPKAYEQALVIHVAGQGLVLITGCGHPTLETLVLRTEKLYGEKVIGVVGGLHYLEASAEDLQPHLQFLAGRQPKLVALSPHDSGPAVLQIFEATFPETYRSIRVGEAIRFP